MKAARKRIFTLLLCMLALILCDRSAVSSEGFSAFSNLPKSVPAEGANLSLIQLPAPKRDGERTYLGLSTEGSFKLRDIKTDLLIIEIFSFYCPHCQRSASAVNELYRKIEERPDKRVRIKIIGIGATNSDYEVNAFKQRYRVPFPMFPDADMDITSKLGATGTPTFIGIRTYSGDQQRQFYFEEGGFQDAQQFLSEIMKSSGLE